MNQTFSFQRWSLLVGKHWAENRKRYLLSILAFMSLLFVWYVFVLFTDGRDPLVIGLQQITFYFTLFLVGPFYASQFFNELNSKTKGTSYLMVPASVLEKLLCSLLYAFVFFFIAFTLAFYLVDVIAVLIANALHPSYNSGITTNEGAPLKAQVINVFGSGGEVPGDARFYFFLIFMAIQSLALLGSVYFTQYNYLKTAIAATLILLVVYLLHYNLTKAFMPNGQFRFDGYEFYQHNGANKYVALPSWVITFLKYLFYYAFPPIFWVTTYYRLKEKEV